MIAAISISELQQMIGTARAPLILDVRRLPAFDGAERMIAGAVRRDPSTVSLWAKTLTRGRDLVVYCVHGHEVSQIAAMLLRDAGFDARYLEGGIEAWLAANAASMAKPSKALGSPWEGRAWITRERPKIDRIACPWLIRRFVDPFAIFRYVAPEHVAPTAKAEGGVPYDIPGVTFSHDGELCSFDAVIKHFDLRDAALSRLADIVRGADTQRPDLTPQSAGLLAISLGLSAAIPDDHAMLEYTMGIYDALYLWCRDVSEERHAWPPNMNGAAA